MALRTMALSLTVALACGGSDPAPVLDAAGAADASPDSPDPITVGGCAPSDLDLCEWIPAPADRYAAAQPVTATLAYVDVTGASRTIEVAIRAPVGAPEPLPVVVWSHGGNDGVMNALNVGTEWAAILVAAGYVVIDVAHAPRDVASRQALCEQLGYDAAGCLTFKYLHWDRPHDAARVFDFIEAQAAAGPWAGRIDAARIVYAGHSAGSGGVLMVDGAPRDYAGQLVSLRDPRPIAFLANSPQGPGDEGFVEASFAGCARPTLVNTGVGDDTNVLGINRARSFDLMPDGDKFRLYLLEPAARHATFDQSGDACATYSNQQGLDAGRCPTYQRWIASSALAFLDAYARDSAAARAYLASDNLTVLAGGAATWDRR
ncbi:MAG: hypothetical protein IPL61_05205 [Myxococcales bacterium]|nr:hypothetical protein [Myxococcales bacterium]